MLLRHELGNSSNLCENGTREKRSLDHVCDRRCPNCECSIVWEGCWDLQAELVDGEQRVDSAEGGGIQN